MSTLSYSAITDYPFQPFAKIFSADINNMFSTIQTWANGNISAVNITAQSLTRYTTSSVLTPGTANYAVYNDSSGNLTEAAALPATCGGLGFVPNFAGTVNQVLASNGSAFQLQAVPPTPGGNIFNFYNFT